LGLAVATRVGASWIERTFPPTGAFVEVEGARLHVLDRGPRARDAIVVIHGASGNAVDLDRVFAPALAATRRVVTIDRPGHGHSSVVDGAHTPDAQARLVARAMERLGIERAVVVGYSFGASVAMALALEAPARVAGLVLIAPATHPWGGGGISWHNRLAAVPWIGPAFARLFPLPLGLLVMDGAVAASFRPDSAPATYARDSAIPLVLRPESFVANARDLDALLGAVTRLQPRYAAIAVPTVAISGTADPIVRADIHTEGIARDVPGARIVWLDGVGHMPHWSRALPRVVQEIEAVAASVLSGAQAPARDR
jgi:pimeloyl-ACP methyl ester carboxylesterase